MNVSGLFRPKRIDRGSPLPPDNRADANEAEQ